MEKISIEVKVNASLQKVWEFWTLPKHIVHWNYASEDWHCPKAENDLQIGGEFLYRMEAKNESMGFDLKGTYLNIIPNEKIVYKMEDDRMVENWFKKVDQGVLVTTIFDADLENPAEMQKQGWQAILDHFKQYVEK
ncbi:SRPBCC family protein [Ochrovirga pacifica]|uniref:SRPBCC family protein n=1 Tax=Ochrovirga pacifica TaxID=1042376 RepID=UPI0002559DC9|nr:SRPBCC family protein [Ochrovirga pacifica]